MKIIMSSPDGKDLLYLNSNDSSLSIIQFQRIPTHVSSVGFNTLKKQTTGSSLNLSITTASTIKPNTLSKLFTRNKSSPNVTEDNTLLLNFEESSSSPLDEEHIGISQRTSGLFKMARKLRPKIKFGNKSVTRPDLTIQTSGHHNLKVPKKILSSATSEDFGGKKAVSSPISRGLFHRQHNQSKTDSQLMASDETSIRPAHSKLHRTAINLSSQSSNSFISDISVAVLFNFTNPDFLAREEDENAENLSLLEFHKMYMTSADHFISLKSSRADSVIQEDDGSREGHHRASKGSKGFDILFEMIKPLCLPSKQCSLSNGVSFPKMTLTVEQASNFVNDSIVNSARTLLKNFPSGSTISTMNEHSGSSAQAVDEFVSKGNLEDDFQDLKRKEQGQHLFHFFEKCCLALVEDLRSVDNLETLGTLQSIPGPLPSKDLAKNYSTEGGIYLYSYLREWKRIDLVWRYFNSKMRYFFLSAFEGLLRVLENEERSQNDQSLNTKSIQIENSLLIAFRDIVVVPHLLQRPSEFEHERFTNVHSASAIDQCAEIEFFNNEGSNLVKSLQHCFGEIITHLQNEFVGSEDQPFKALVFEDYTRWFGDCVYSRTC